MKLLSGPGMCLAILASPLLSQSPLDADARLHLRHGTYTDAHVTDVAPVLRGASDTNLWLVQFRESPTDRMREGVLARGGEIVSYVPDNTYVVRLPVGTVFDVARHSDVRTVGQYHPALRLDPVLINELAANAMPERRYNIVVANKHSDKPSLARAITAIGGRVDDHGGGSLLMSATLDAAELVQVARLDTVLWIDVWGAPEDDMDNARIQGGANYIESVGGYTGQGIVGHQMEGLNPNHQDWNLRPIGGPSGCTSSSSHGHNTAGIVYGNGSSSPTARGMAPDAQCVFTSCRTNRWNNLQTLINQHEIMFTTASWGSPRTRQYTSVSAEADDICFDHDLVWTNSQSNAGNQDSRAEAWAKNVMACGGVSHNNNANPADDSWQRGSASIGPAADGRTKPDLTAYYDGIATSSSSGGFTSSFGGTSGATPIVAGHNALAIQMFTDGVFGNTLRVPGGTRFQNKPRFATLKALQMANSSQYPFTASSNDNRREHQGYGFPNLRSMWDNRNVMFIVDEEDIIEVGEGVSYTLSVPAARNALNISMSYADVAANPSASKALVNDLTLRVTSPSGVRYWGNFGLDGGVWSVPGGERDRLNTAENVYVQNPEAGDWTVDVIAYVVAADTHVETAEMDADYGLVVNGGTLVSKRGISISVGRIDAFGDGCEGTAPLPVYCLTNNPNGGTLEGETRQYIYAYEVQASSPTVVEGFELWTRSTSGSPTTVSAFLYKSAGNRPQNSPFRTSTITVDGAQGFYTATFESPMAVEGGETFYIAVRHANRVEVSTLTSGASSRAFYRDNNQWSQSTLASEPSFRVVCQGTGGLATPLLDLNGVAETGQTLTADLSLAVANSGAILVVGGSNTQWGPVNLPFEATPIGAAGCTLYASIDAVLPMATDGNGNGQAQVGIPLGQSFIGSQAFLQVLVVDPGANNLGLAFTGAYALTIGG